MDTHPLRPYIRRFSRNLTRNLFVAQIDDCFIVADEQNDATGCKSAQELSKSGARTGVEMVSDFI